MKECDIIKHRTLNGNTYHKLINLFVKSYINIQNVKDIRSLRAEIFQILFVELLSYSYNITQLQLHLFTITEIYIKGQFTI